MDGVCRRFQIRQRRAKRRDRGWREELRVLAKAERNVEG